jgi:hypothetical protein
MWAYPVNTLIKIDNGNVTHNVDLDDHSLPQTKSGLQESIGWSVLWGSGELENTLHTIVASRPPGGPQYVVVDAFMCSISTFTLTTDGANEVQIDQVYGS